MSSEKPTLPDDVEALKALVCAQREEIEALKLQIVQLKRLVFGRRAERVQKDALERAPSRLQAVSDPGPRKTPRRTPLPEHLPRETEIDPPESMICPHCQGVLHAIGEDVSEQLEYVPGRFKVIRHIRPKHICRRCVRIMMAPAPSRPLMRALPGPGLLAHVLVSKYSDHLPLYRQSEMYAREGMLLARSTLADWVGAAARLLHPLVEALRCHVLKADKLHADDIPIPVLEPGSGKTRTGRLWTYVRDDRPAGDSTPPAVWFAYSPDRRAHHPQAHLNDFQGFLQADGYAGFNALYDTERIQEVACWAHARRKFYELYQAHSSPLAAQALQYIQQLYGIETCIRAQPPDLRLDTRQRQAIPVLAKFHDWLSQTLAQISRKSALAGAIRYALTRWNPLTRYCENGALEIDNNAAERALRTVALGRKNYLFVGSDAGGLHAAALYSLIGTAKLNGLDPYAYLHSVLVRIAECPAHRVDQLLPWHLNEFSSDQRTRAA